MLIGHATCKLGFNFQQIFHLRRRCLQRKCFLSKNEALMRPAVSACTLIVLSQYSHFSIAFSYRSPEDSAFNQRNDTLFRQNKPSQSDDATLKKARKKANNQVTDDVIMLLLHKSAILKKERKVTDEDTTLNPMKLHWSVMTS